MKLTIFPNVAAAAVVLGYAGWLASAAGQKAEAWTFDRLDKIGGLPMTVLGHPRVIGTPLGNAIRFNGVDDALFIDKHPLAGVETFTWEAIFRPESGGAEEQRWFQKLVSRRVCVYAESDAGAAESGTAASFGYVASGGDGV